MLAPIDIERACSSGSKSKVVEPSSTLPSRLMTPASNRSASQRLVFPVADQRDVADPVGCLVPHGSKYMR